MPTGNRARARRSFVVLLLRWAKARHMASGAWFSGYIHDVRASAARAGRVRPGAVGCIYFLK